MRRAIRLLALILGCLLVTGDTQPPKASATAAAPTVTRGDTCGSTQAPLTAITWNVALAPGMNTLYGARRAPVVEAVRTTSYDIMCVQEAWKDEDKRAIIAASGLPPENVFVHDTSGLAEDDADICNSSVLGLLTACTKIACAGHPPEEATLCAMESCRTELKLLYASDQRCLNCLAAMVGHSAQEIADGCNDHSASRVYGGSNGVMILSKWPLYDKEIVSLPSSSANLPALMARVKVPGMSEPIEVACTHLSSPQPIPPTHTKLPTWEDEQRAQLHVIKDRLAERAQGRPQLFMGDMNFCGGDDITLRSFSGQACEDAVRAGFEDPAAQVDPPFCSICGENNVRGAPGGLGMLFDHVLYRDPPGGATLEPVCADRLLDQPVTVTDHAGARVPSYLSDHYAVRVKFGFQ